MLKAEQANVHAVTLLAGLLMGRRAVLHGLAALASDSLLEHAQQHGVVSLADHQLGKLLQDPAVRACGPVFEVLQETADALSLAARDETLVSMLLEAETRSVLRVLASNGTPSLLLKGSALAYWAYQQPHWRRCKDIDVLVPTRQAAEQLAASLQALGYVRSAIVSEPVAYELLCSRPLPAAGHAEIDIHWRMNNSALFAKLFDFEELMQRSVALPRLDPHARVLGPAHAVLHACTHRALNLATGWEDLLKWLYDLIVLMELLSPQDWDEVIELSRDKQLAGVVLSGLEAAAAAFQYGAPAPELQRLREMAEHEPLDRRRLSDWRYMQWRTFLALRGHRMRWLWQRVFPTRARLVSIYGDHDHYGALLWLRVKRAIMRLASP